MQRTDGWFPAVGVAVGGGQEIGLGGQNVRETGRKTPYKEVQRQKGMKKAKMIVWDPGGWHGLSGDRRGRMHLRGA